MAMLRPALQSSYQQPLQRYSVQPHAVYPRLPAYAKCDPNISGLKARLNHPAFQYLSALFANILNDQIIDAEIPPITECVPGLPIYFVVEIVIKEKCDHFVIEVAGCSMRVGYVDLYMERAGLIGDLTNGLFRGISSELMRQMIPAKVCAMVPQLIDEKVNSRLATIPTTISVGQILQMLGGLDGLIGSGIGIHRCAKAAHLCQSAQPKQSEKSLAGQQLVPLTAGFHPMQTTFTATDAAKHNQLNTNITKPIQQMGFTPAITFIKNISISEVSKLPPSKHPSVTGLDIPIELNFTDSSSNVANVSEEMALAMLSELLDLSDVKGGESKIQFTMDDIKKMLHNGTDNEMNRKLLYKLAEMTKSGATSEGYQMLEALRQVAHDLANRYKRSSKQEDAVPLVNKSPQKIRLINNATMKTTKTHESKGKTTRKERKAAPRAVVPVLTLLSSEKPKQQPRANSSGRPFVTGKMSKAHGCPTCAGGTGGSSLASSSALSPVGDLCAGCPGVNRQTSPLDLIKQLTRTIDLRKLCNVYLSLKLLRTLATCWDYSIDLKGEFSLFNQDQTPFCPAPTFFPGCANCMTEVIISDYTINSLFYHMHRAALLNFRIGPDTPGIGPLMRTTCQKGDIEGGIPLCIGEFIPAFSSYPNKAVAVNINIVRAPVIVLSRGCATMEFVADADICVTGTLACEGGERVGAVEIMIIADICPQSAGGRLYGAGNVQVLRITEKRPSLGLEPGTLDQFSVLGKELMTKALNDALAKGISMKSPSGAGLPLMLRNTNFKIIEHGIYISSDFTISPSLFSGSVVCPR
uniref:Lipid-binding serum glycoprotein C-terminal domain-containing protein n=1 Tax=Parascaris univalens TaxID=6257 RepID=A0A914ZMM2_PARUN